VTAITHCSNANDAAWQERRRTLQKHLTDNDNISIIIIVAPVDRRGKSRAEDERVRVNQEIREQIEPVAWGRSVIVGKAQAESRRHVLDRWAPAS
jgi:hypothetical protein